MRPRRMWAWCVSNRIGVSLTMDKTYGHGPQPFRPSLCKGLSGPGVKPVGPRPFTRRPGTQKSAHHQIAPSSRRNRPVKGTFTRPQNGHGKNLHRIALLPLRGARGQHGFPVKHHNYGGTVSMSKAEAGSGRCTLESRPIKLTVDGGARPRDVLGPGVDARSSPERLRGAPRDVSGGPVGAPPDRIIGTTCRAVPPLHGGRHRQEGLSAKPKACYK